MPVPFDAIVGTTGMPIILPKSSYLKSMSFSFSSSNMFSAITTLMSMSMSCVVRNRFRSRFDASSTFTTMSGFFSMMCFLTYSSSGEYSVME